ncbi:hypothetical protein K469DRAFT_603790, partial [Zopfia rhizophila CBS 207.26]
TFSLVFSLTTLALTAPQPQNTGRPISSGVCCTPNTSLEQDVCNVNGSTGRCVPSGSAGGGALICVTDANLTYDPNTLERGRPLCRKTIEAGV